MKVVILAGGRGRRIWNGNGSAPKPLVRIGGRPIIWHVLKHYASHGFSDFVVCVGHRGDEVEDWFASEGLLDSEPCLGNRLSNGGSTGDVRSATAEDEWTVQVVDTGEDVSKGGRILRVRDRIGDEPFMLTYADGVSDVDVSSLVRFHRRHGRAATVSAVHPPGRFGRLCMDGDRVVRFDEKSASDEWINGGFMVLEPVVLEYLERRGCDFEAGALADLAADDQLRAYRHEGFWQCVDTPKEARLLDLLWREDRAPWKIRDREPTGQ